MAAEYLLVQATTARRHSPQAVAALEAVARSWSVVPLHDTVAGRCSCGDLECASPGKHARIAWKRYMDVAADSELVTRWWHRWPGANIGVVTGAISGLLVLDVDPRHGGEETLFTLETINGPLPQTVEARTGGGGRHFYFRHPGVPTSSRQLGPGLDIKGDGGLVVCPPGQHASGGTYAWVTGLAPSEVALAEIPWWLRTMIGTANSLWGGRKERTDPAAARTAGERAQFSELWRWAGIELRPGDRYYLCPFHADHHPSLHIDAEGCRFYCFGCGAGGGSGRLRRLLGRRRLPSGPQESLGSPETFPGAAALVSLPGTETVEVVGESSHQQTLIELAGGRRSYRGVRVTRVANLVPEPGNPVDPLAIAVVIGGRTVGYLPRSDAVRYGPTVRIAIDQSGHATCLATIVGGWEREHGNVGFFGVRLRLGIIDNP